MVNGAMYRPDIPIKTALQRKEAGLPPRTVIWPCQGDQLPHLPVKTPGLHWPFAYHSDAKFGALFTCHREDYDLYSINHLRIGRKIWITIPGRYAAALEKCLQETGIFQAPHCAQFVRHDSLFIPRRHLEIWKIPYHVIDQHANQIVITEPRVYHQGFSVGSSNAKAVNWAGQNWTAKDYPACTVVPCGPQAITMDRMDLELPPKETSIKAPVVTSKSVTKGNPNPTTKTSRAKRSASQTRLPLDKSKLKTRSRPFTVNLDLSALNVPDTVISQPDLAQKLTGTANPGLLTALFYHIGSAQALSYLLHACKSIRQQSDVPTLSSATIGDTIQSIDYLEQNMVVNVILRRYHLVRLMEHQQALYKSMDIQDIPETNIPLRAKSDALNSMVAIAFPHLAVPRYQHLGSEEFKHRRKQLQNRLYKARNWNSLVNRFGIAILALVPVGKDNEFTTTSIEQVQDLDFEQFANLLEIERGDFLRKMSQELTDYVFVLLQKSNTTRSYVFEETESTELEKAELDSADIISACVLKL